MQLPYRHLVRPMQNILKYDFREKHVRAVRMHAQTRSRCMLVGSLRDYACYLHCN